MPTAELNGTTLSYERLGEAGPPVLLVMGLRARGLAWRPLATRLSLRHQVVYWDNRGVGDSAPLAGPTSMAEMASDGLALMTHLGWNRAHVVGVSMGGMISQQLVLMAPERVATLTLIASTAHGRGLQRTSLRNILQYFATFFGDPVTRLQKLSRMLYSDDHIEAEGMDNVVVRMQQAFGHDHAGTARAQIRAVRSSDFRDRLGQISAPTLVVCAQDDVIVPERHGRLLADRIPQATFLRIPGARHGVVVEAADHLSAAIGDHISATEG